MVTQRIKEIIVNLHQILEQQKQSGSSLSGYIVGGFVRDLLLGRTSIDLDVMLLAESRLIAKLFADRFGGSFIVLDQVHDVYRVVFKQDGIVVDIVGAKGNTLEEDLQKRDFTINSLAINISDFVELLHAWPLINRELLVPIIVDVVNGLNDLSEKTISSICAESLSDDPLRILRGIRLAARLGFCISKQTFLYMSQNISQLQYVSYERIREEVWSILTCLSAAEWISYMVWELPVLQQIAPALFAQVSKEDIENKLKVLAKIEEFMKIEELAKIKQPTSAKTEVATRVQDYLSRMMTGGKSRYPLLKFAGLLIGLKRSDVRAIAAEWKLSRRETQLLSLWTAGFIEQQQDLFTLYEYYQEDALGMIILRHAVTASDAKRMDGAINEWFCYYDRVSSLPQLVTGTMIIDKLGIPPGKKIEECLHIVRRAQFAGQLQSTQQALDYVRKYM